MIIYRNDKAGFLRDAFEHDIEDVVLDSYRAQTGRGVSKQEIRSWASSLIYMARVVNTDDIPSTAGIAIEYTIPQTSKRVDFIISGKTDDNQSAAVIVELKQWEKVELTEKDAIVITALGGAPRETSHPSYQAWSYAALLKGFNEAVYEGGITLHPCAYLHNYPPPGGAVVDIVYDHHIQRAPIFLRGPDERDKLRQFIQMHVKFGDNGQTLYDIENGRIRPSKGLADAMEGLLKGNEEFVLVDDQKVVYENSLAAAKSEDGKRRVILVDGGPGTGKSVVAVNLLVALTRGGLTAKYVTKNAAPRAVYEARLVGSFRKSEFSHMFAGSGQFTTTEPDSFDALVVDEAHRLNEKSGLFANLGENQIKELIQAARTTIFFVDNDQRVHLRDIGHSEEILQWARGLGAHVTMMKLESQFRCNGSDGYLAWVDNTLQVRPTANEKLDDNEFDFQVFDSPTDLHMAIIKRNMERNRARMVAGYCWPWPSKKDPRQFDIVIPEHGFEARWNLVQDGSLWIMAEESVAEVGCIHTCQGLEVDYVGVIIGDDLVVRDGRVVCRPEARARSDQSIKGWKKLIQEDPAGGKARLDAMIKNTYRTLLTRGMKGCYVYCTDKETAEYFRACIGSHQ